MEYERANRNNSYLKKIIFALTFFIIQKQIDDYRRIKFKG